MMRREYWDEIEGIGKVYMETELVVGVETVLFVCINDEGRWLFMTYDSGEGDYVFCKVEENTLVEMLSNRITMEEVYRKAEYIGETYIDDEDRMKFDRYEPDHFRADRLPDKGAYYDIKSEYINGYISELQQYCEGMYEVIDYSYGEEPLGDVSMNMVSDIIKEVVQKWYESSFGDKRCPAINCVQNHSTIETGTVEKLLKVMMPINLDVGKDGLHVNDTVNIAA